MTSLEPFAVNLDTTIDNIDVRLINDFTFQSEEEEDDRYGYVIIATLYIYHRTLLCPNNAPRLLFKKDFYLIDACLKDGVTILCADIAECSKQLQFDQYRGVFEKNRRHMTAQAALLENFARLEMPTCDEGCCVCYEKTITTTVCGHTLCIGCAQRLDNKRCPLCRRSPLLMKQIKKTIVHR
jgi:hypothetical protein